MNEKELVKTWFNCWKNDNYINLPITNEFIHTSPFGTIKGKKEYLNLINNNKDKFLGYTFKIVDEIYSKNSACIRYIAIQGDFNLEVSEWYYFKDKLINKIVAYYHIGEIRSDRKLTSQ